MATTSGISSLGVGSGIDANTIISKLMAVEQQPLNQLNARKGSYETKISAFGSLKSLFDTLKSASDTLADPAKLAAYTATVGDEDIIAASAGSFANGGSYSVEVTQLAKAQKSFSNVYASGTSFGAGTLSLTIGSTTTDIAFSGGSINDLRNAINDAGLGVTATTVTGDAGTRLVFSGKDTGTDNAFSLSVSGGDANLTSLATFDAANPNAVAAQNAILKVEGETVTSQSNTVSSAIPNVTITAKTVGTSTLDVARSTSSTVDAVNAFITAFNDAAKKLKSTSAYDSSSKTAGPLNGDATVRSLQSLTRNAIATIPSSVAGTTYSTLSSLGVSFQTDGTLKLDESKLTDAITADSSGVIATLNAYGDAMSEVADQATGVNGLISNRTDGLGATVKRMEDQATKMQYQLSLTEQRMRAQYTALDTLMGQLNTTSTYLMQQFVNLNK